MIPIKYDTVLINNIYYSRSNINPISVKLNNIFILLAKFDILF